MRKLRSDITREGLARTPHRAFMRAMGLDDTAIQKPDDRRRLARRSSGLSNGGAVRLTSRVRGRLAGNTSQTACGA